jgi:hypothetical protein
MYFIGASHKSTTFPAPMFVKFINAQQHYVQISYTDVHPNRTINVGLKVRTEIRLHIRVKYNFYCTDLRETHISHPVSSVDISCVRLYPYQKKKCRKGQRFYMPRSKVWLSLHRFSRSSRWLDGITWQSSVLNFTQIGQEMCNVRVEIRLRS